VIAKPKSNLKAQERSSHLKINYYTVQYLQIYLQRAHIVVHELRVKTVGRRRQRWTPQDAKEKVFVKAQSHKYTGIHNQESWERTFS